MNPAPRVAVIGSGPAGIYTADALTKSAPDASVDVFDALPAPFGLVRYGVAPDHTKIKSIVRTLADVLQRPGVRLLGNVTFGVDLAPADLAEFYHAVVIATGSPDDRRLGISGEDLPGSTSAADFVSWYSGHPAAPTDWRLATGHVVVVGAGNVALDVARVISKGASGLSGTDLPDDVLATLRTSEVTDVHVVARRGPAQARFTPLELREFGALPDTAVVVDPDQVELDAASAELARGSRSVRTIVDLFRGWSQGHDPAAARRVHFHFWSRPERLLGTDRVTGLELEVCAPDLAGNPVGTGEHVILPTELVIRAIGYRARPVPGLPFDDARGVVPHEQGRVGAPLAGTSLPAYVAGWVKRGPTGVIGTNRSDAAETVRTLLADAAAGNLPDPPYPDPEVIIDRLRALDVPVVVWSDWERLDAHERDLGERQGRERAKVADRAAMVRIARGG